MSFLFVGVTFAEQKVTPSDDAEVRRALLPDGILSRCAFSYSGTTLTMDAGSLLICGRQIRHTAAQNWPIVDASSGFARLVLTVDMTRPSTKDAFEQVLDSIEYASSEDGFSILEQTDINAGGTRYQIAACVVSLGASGITGIVDSIVDLSRFSAYAPAGYGLGSEAPPEIISLAQLDTLTKSGWYRLNISSGSSTIGGVNFNQATVFVEGYDSTATNQTISRIGSPTKVSRSRVGSRWGSWSFENPPMALGVEYRTAELWKDRPVYIKRIAYSTDSFYPQWTYLGHNISNLDVCISADAIWRHTSGGIENWRFLPSTDTLNQADGQIEFVDDTQIRFYINDNLFSMLEASDEPVYVTLKYTKK